MSNQESYSRVCSCGKGYRSKWDLKCGYCRTKVERAKLLRMFQTMEQQVEVTQRAYMGFYAPCCQPGDAIEVTRG